MFSQEFLGILRTPTQSVAMIRNPPTELVLTTTEAQCNRYAVAAHTYIFTVMYEASYDMTKDVEGSPRTSEDD